MDDNTVKKERKFSTIMLVKMAMLIAISIVLVLLIHFPIFPVVSFLEYDPADIPILIGTMAFGPVAGVILTVVTAVIQGFTVSAASGVYGIIMHIVATLALTLTSGIIYKNHRTLKGAIVALLWGIAAMTIIMIPANMLITPYFMGMSLSALLPYMIWIILFNLIKATINSLVTFIVYPRIARFLK